MHINVAEIRRRFPKPCSAAKESKAGEYSVDGAFCAYRGMTQSRWRKGFTNVQHLAGALQDVNVHLSWSRAVDFARRIILANDREKFDDAWKLLDKALRHKE